MYLQGDKLVTRAAEIAEKWHEGQQHSFGSDSYFNMHLAPVAKIVRRLGYGAVYIAGAYLHDIKEDTSITDDELEAEGMPVGLVFALNLLAKKDGLAHEEYLRGILTSPIATVDKFADSSFNFSYTLLNSPNIPDQKFREWSLEYLGNLATLGPNLPPVKKV